MSDNTPAPTPAATSLLTPATIGILVLPPLMWAGNSILGRVVADMVPPITLNFFRWLLAFVLLLPWGWRLLLPSSVLWQHWRRYAVLSLLGVGCYNSFQYLALHTSTPINVTLVASSVPVFMLAMGALWFKQRITRRQLLGAAMSQLQPSGVHASQTRYNRSKGALVMRLTASRVCIFSITGV